MTVASVRLGTYDHESGEWGVGLSRQDARRLLSYVTREGHVLRCEGRGLTDSELLPPEYHDTTTYVVDDDGLTLVEQHGHAESGWVRRQPNRFRRYVDVVARTGWYRIDVLEETPTPVRVADSRVGVEFDFCQHGGARNACEECGEDEAETTVQSGISQFGGEGA